MTTDNEPEYKNCKDCGKPFQTGGYAHPSKCWHCAPVGVPKKR